MMSIIIFAWATACAVHVLYLLDMRTLTPETAFSEFSVFATVTAAAISLCDLILLPIIDDTISVYEVMAIASAIYVGCQYMILPALNILNRSIEMYFRMKDNLGNQSVDKAVLGTQALVAQASCLLAILLESRIDPSSGYLVGAVLWYLVAITFFTFGPMVLKKMES